MKVALVGPCSPADLAGEFYPDQMDRAIAVPGYRGVPVSELARGLLKQGHQVSIATIAYKSITKSETFSGPNLELVVHPGRPRAREFLIDNYRQERGVLSESVRGFKPDIVHGHWTYEFALGALDSGFPCGVTAHDSPYTVVRYFKDAYRTARLLIAQQVAFRAQHLSAVSPYLRERWRNQMLYRRHIEVIPNSAPTDTVASQRRPSPTPVILSIGDSSGRKNIPKLIRAFSEVKVLLPSAELRLIGPGLGREDALCARTATLGLDDGVTFVGLLSRKQLADEYSKAWLLAHPSLEECCPMTLLEALGAGVPALGGRQSGGVPYVLDDGRQGMLCDVKDPLSMAKSILDLIESGVPELRPEANEYVETKFSLRAVTEMYLDWYGHILQAN